MVSIIVSAFLDTPPPSAERALQGALEELLESIKTSQEGPLSMQSPLSESSTCSLIKNIDPGEISARWRKELSIDWLPDPLLSKIQYWRDNESGLYFYTPGLAAGNEKLYVQLQKFPWYYLEEKWEFSQAIGFLKNFIQAPSPQLLEIGAGTGAFLRQAKHAGFEISGVELNPEGAAAARKEGFHIFEDDLETLFTEQSMIWDGVCAFQVLEHLSDPRVFLEQVLALLKPGGVLILSVPNADVSSFLDPERNDLLDQPPHHMSHWNIDVFKYLELILPVRLLCVAFEPLAPYHIDWFLSALSSRMRGAGGRLLAKALFNRYSLRLVRSLLVAGVRKLVKGHTLLVCLEKI